MSAGIQPSSSRCVPTSTQAHKRTSTVYVASTNPDKISAVIEEIREWGPCAGRDVVGALVQTENPQPLGLTAIHQAAEFRLAQLREIVSAQEINSGAVLVSIESGILEVGGRLLDTPLVLVSCMSLIGLALGEGVPVPGPIPPPGVKWADQAGIKEQDPIAVIASSYGLQITRREQIRRPVRTALRSLAWC